jgi:hypothetical protein
MVASGGSPSGSAERRLEELGIQLPAAPVPFGSYVEAVQTGNLLFLSGMLPVMDHKPKYLDRSERNWMRRWDAMRCARRLWAR